MEILEKHGREIYNLLQEVKGANSNKLHINELLLVNLCSLCKYVSGKENFKDSTTLDSILYGKQDDKIIISKEEKNKQSLIWKETNNDFSNFEKSFDISKIEKVKKNIKADFQDLRLSFQTEKSLDSRNTKRMRDTFVFDEESKHDILKMNENNFDYYSEKEDISTIYNMKTDNSFQTNYMDMFNDEKLRKSTIKNMNNTISWKMKQEESQNESSISKTITSFDLKQNSQELKKIKDLINTSLDDKQILQISKEMNVEYILDLFSTYQKMKKHASKNSEVENIIFVNRFKQFLLEIGISEKRLYEQCIRLIIYKKNVFTFYDFHVCFHKILNLKYEYNFLKYKLLYNLTNRKDDKLIEPEELENYLKLLKSARVYDQDIFNRIKIKLKDKFKEIFPKLNTLHFKKLSLVLELFLNIR